MATLKVAQMGHPVLRLIAQPVDPAFISTPEFQRLCDDMLETMDAYDGTGLAAPQVHISLRVAVLTLDDDREPEFFINPVITPLTKETSSMMEGCLSVEGMRGRVWRPDHIKVEALGRDGKPKAYELEGFPAIVVQHECDHLDGVLYIDRCDTQTLAFTTEYKRFGPLDEWMEEAAREDDDDPDRTLDDAEDEPMDTPRADAIRATTSSEGRV